MPVFHSSSEFYLDFFAVPSTYSSTVFFLVQVGNDVTDCIINRHQILTLPLKFACLKSASHFSPGFNLLIPSAALMFSTLFRYVEKIQWENVI